MKATNLVSLSDIIKSSIQDDGLKYLGYSIKKTEKEIIPVLCQRLLDVGASVADLNGFYFGYNIPQIGKELDFLRIGDCVVNIEIKTEADEAKVKHQLVQNKLYLSSLNKQVFLYSYVYNEDKLFILDEDDNLLETDFMHLLDTLKNQKDLYQGNIDNLFRAKDFLVSPFNSTDGFLENRYFLTPQQANIEEEICKLFNGSFRNIVAINGEAGTGKSLLLYDIAKKYIEKGENPIIVHVGLLNPGHEKLMVEKRFSISPIKTFMDNIGQLNNFDVILIDEAHRLKPWQIKKIFDYVLGNRINCVLAYDEKQILSRSRHEKGTVEFIQQQATHKYTLGKKIRTNAKLWPFINSMFDLRKGGVTRTENISVVYFDSFDKACGYIESGGDFKFIRYTPSLFYPTKLNSLQGLKTCVGTAHEVIGQEFDNVSVLIEDSFFYDENGRLQSHNAYGNLYDFLGMLYQAVTRAREKLEIVVCNNKEVYQRLLGVFE